jgi:hypothetical protein
LKKYFLVPRILKGGGKGTYAVIQSMVEEPSPHGSSQLLTVSKGLHEKDVFHFQRVDSFVNPIFVVDTTLVVHTNPFLS